MSTYSYQTVDVFTTTRFGGNPLAVFPDARGLDSAQMQRIAKEFNYSETTFVLPPQDPANTAQVRIFTPSIEMPFAGHPNVGTGYVLARLGSLFGQPVGAQMRFEERAGLVGVTVQRADGQITSVAISAPEGLTVGATVPVTTVAECVALDAAEVDTAAHQPLFASVGAPFVIARLRSRSALANAKPNVAAFAAAQAAQGTGGLEFALFLYSARADTPHSYDARMFAPLDGVLEDPATGSAAGAFAALLTSLEPEADLARSISIEQGVDFGRPSAIAVAVTKAAGTVTRVVIAGSCVPVMRGELTT